MVVGIKIEDAFRLGFTFLFDNRFEQLLFVFEIDIERALGDPGGTSDVVHAGGIEALRQKYRAGAADDLTALGAILVGRGRGSFQNS